MNFKHYVIAVLVAAILLIGAKWGGKAIYALAEQKAASIMEVALGDIN